MIDIGLDLAVRTVGLAIRHEDRELEYESFKSKEKDYFELQIEMTNWVFRKIEELLQLDHRLTLEGIFSGVNPKAALTASRIQGGVIERYYRLTQKFPRVLNASTARKLAGMPVKLSKTEIQIEMAQRYNLGKIDSNTIGTVVRTRNGYESLKARMKVRRKGASKVLLKRLKKEQTEAKKECDRVLSRMSTQIKREIGLDEHMADAIVLIVGD